jgi:4-hydroxybenzoate polyprenyltransferase
MALCRALNLLLGIAAVPSVLLTSWPLGIIPFLYITAVTALSRGEVHGGDRGPATFALSSLAAACAALLIVAARSQGHAFPALVLAIGVGWRVMPPFWTARQTGAPGAIRSAVRRGVLSLVLVDATIGAAYSGPIYAAIILATGLGAWWLARVFAVT